MAAPLGISLAPDDYALAGDPVWERIDTAYTVNGWTVDRGRQNEMGQTGTGTAHIELVDRNGDFDPTNTSGHFYGRLPAPYNTKPMGPLVQAAICLQNPVTAAWSTLFRGYISQIQYAPYATEQFANVTIDLVDALAVFAAAEMTPGPSWGDDFVDGNIVFNEDVTLDAVQTRLGKVLDSMGWDPGLRNLFTGNVALQKTVYAPRSTALQVMLDAADAEFPNIANLFIGGPRNPGKVVFHGRKARFEPANYATNGIQTWKAGDDAAALADPTHVVRISPPLTASLDDTLLYTSALATPQNIADADIPGQYIESPPPAVATKGVRTWSAENLATRGGEGPTTGEEETRKFASYVADNYLTPFVRVGQLTVKGRRPTSSYGPAAWALLCGVEISDLVHLKTSHHGGGGFDTDFYVEGIHYTARPGSLTPIVELTLDVSPAGYYTNNPWA